MVAAAEAHEDLHFYKNLAPISDYKKICDLKYYSQVPASWWVFICDIRGSTQAIAEGRYKEVNFVGAACIMVLVNSLKGLSIPYVFGGDGATLLIPNEFRDKAIEALSSLKSLAAGEYKLDLLVGAIQVRELLAENYSLQIGKFSLSGDLAIALFSGNGFFTAEAWIKSQSKERYLIKAPDGKSGPANLDGLECRWEAFPSTRGEILTVLVRAATKDMKESAVVYQEVIEEIDVICGTKEQVNPASLDKLKFPGDMSVEKKAKSNGKSFWERIKIAYRFFVAAVAGKIFLTFNMKVGDFDWGNYKKEVVSHSDYWKFDDTLRFVFDVSPAQKRALLACLDNKKREGKIHFGTHSSSAALMTCLIFERKGNHVHFIDGADGGYALAATQLKESIKNAVDVVG